MKREEVLRSPAYWFEHEQNELFRQVHEYMEREGINRTELASRLNVSKGYVSQILNGNFNYTLKKWIELCLAIGVVPAGYKKVDEVIKEEKDSIAKTEYECYVTEKAGGIFKHWINITDNDTFNTSNMNWLSCTEITKASSNTLVGNVDFAKASSYLELVHQE